MSWTKTIGIIGGGQLGQMMAISAIYMGHKVIALDPAAAADLVAVIDLPEEVAEPGLRLSLLPASSLCTVTCPSGLV